MFRGRYDRQRTLAIRIAAITLASASAITIARFRPCFAKKAKFVGTVRMNFFVWEGDFFLPQIPVRRRGPQKGALWLKQPDTIPPIRAAKGESRSQLHQGSIKAAPQHDQWRNYHLTENYYIINSETISDVNNYISFSKMNSHNIDVM